MTTPNAGSESTKTTMRRLAGELLAAQPDGLSFTKLRDGLVRLLPDVPLGTIEGGLSDFGQDPPADIRKPSRGLYVHVKYADAAASPRGSEAHPSSTRVKEREFYGPFADWLVHEVEECTRAIPLGGNVFGGRWGTPDVIGIREKQRGSLIDFPTEIVSAEVKTDGTQLIVAFGQAVAYRLFSHKSYLVVPNDSPELDVARLDVLSRIVGIGLILFDASSVDTPQFSIRVRAQRQEPDGFYLNDCVRLAPPKLFGE